MSVEDKNTVDAFSITPEGKVRLLISDHLEWDQENKHLLTLQEKINTYLRVIESGEIYEVYPQSEGKEFIIQIMMKYSPNETALEFLNRVEGMLDKAGYEFQYRYFDPEELNYT